LGILEPTEFLKFGEMLNKEKHLKNYNQLEFLFQLPTNSHERWELVDMVHQNIGKEIEITFPDNEEIWYIFTILKSTKFEEKKERKRKNPLSQGMFGKADFKHEFE